MISRSFISQPSGPLARQPPSLPPSGLFPAPSLINTEAWCYRDRAEPATGRPCPPAAARGRRAPGRAPERPMGWSAPCRAHAGYRGAGAPADSAGRRGGRSLSRRPGCEAENFSRPPLGSEGMAPGMDKSRQGGVDERYLATSRCL